MKLAIIAASKRNKLQILVLLLGIIFIATNIASAGSLSVKVIAQYNNLPLVFDSIALTNNSGQKFSVTRLDFLLSDVAVHRSDGSWIEKTNWQEFISLRENRSTFRFGQIPSVNYDRIRFHVGVRPEINHSKPEQYPPDHPLNPVLNGLHWGWAGGYVFFAIEGNWKTEAGKTSGYSFHLGNDPQLMTVEIPILLNLEKYQSVELALNLNQLFAEKFGENNSTTHSRKGDEVATRLKKNVESAFSVVGTRSTSPHSGQQLSSSDSSQTFCPAELKITDAVERVPTVHPYRFTFSSQFPTPDLPRDNPLTEEGVELGHRLFGEMLLSINGQQSCASCHRVESAFSDPGKRFNPGAEGKLGTRNSMPIFNLAWKKTFFWDGRAPSLREQVLQPIQNPIEMHQTLDRAIAKLSATGRAGSPLPAARKNDGAHGVTHPTDPPDYPAEFEKSFGSSEITSDRIARALEQFLLTQVSYDSKFDRAMDGKENLSDEEKRGFQLFNTEYDPRREQYGADCFHCHGGPLFQSQSFANNGLDTEFIDLGRFDVTKKEGDKGKFSVPSLRNVAVTAPYMHDGRFKNLEGVIEHYTTGMKRSETLDPNLAKHPDGGVPLSDADKKALLAFLKTLTDEKFVSPRNVPPPSSQVSSTK